MGSKIGFVGVGFMGSAMVGRLQDCNYQMIVLGNKDRTGLEKAVARGGREAVSGSAFVCKFPVSVGELNFIRTKSFH